jgi:hypothetical protein
MQANFALKRVIRLVNPFPYSIKSAFPNRDKVS